MEVNETTPTEAPQQEISQATEESTSLQSPVEKFVSDKLSQETQSAETEQQPVAYQPNFKFSVMKKEMEIPEEFRGFITDAEKEKKVKELFEKSYGLDHVKSERDRLRGEYQDFKRNTDPLLKIAQKAQAAWSKKDYRTYFETLGVPKQVLFEYAIKEAELDQLPQDQKAIYDQHRAAEQRAQQLEEMLQAKEYEHQEIRTQQLSTEIEQTLNNPQVMSFREAFDRHNGDGAFLNELVSRGRQIFAQRGIDAPPQALADEMIRMYGFGMGQMNQSQVGQLQTQAPIAQQTIVAPKQVPVIPNTGNSNASPAKKKVTSIADIQKAYDSL